MSGTVYLVGAGPGAGRTGLPEKNRIRVEIVPGVTAALAADTVVIYMGAGEAESIAGVLTGAGKSPATPVALVEHASLPGERIVLAFPDLMQPSLPACAASLHGEGVRSLRVVPVFLGSSRPLASNPR